jgi:hypothetical protein
LSPQRGGFRIAPTGEGLLPLTVLAVKIAGNGSGAFAGAPLGGPMPILGSAALKASHGGGPVTLASVPLFTSHTRLSSALGMLGRRRMRARAECRAR